MSVVAGARRFAHTALLRADSGFFAEELLQYLEDLKLGYIVVAKLTPWLKREAARVKEWRALDATYAVGEFRLKLWGWDRERRFVVVREEMQESKRFAGSQVDGGSGLHVSGVRDQPARTRRKRSGATTISGPASSSALRN